MSALISRPFIKAAAPSHRWGAFCWVQLANGLMAGGNCVRSQANSLSVSLCSMYGGAHSRLTMDLQSLTGHPHCLSQVPSNKSTHKATVPTQFQCHTGKISDLSGHEAWRTRCFWPGFLLHSPVSYVYHCCASQFWFPRPEKAFWEWRDTIAQAERETEDELPLSITVTI